MLDSDEVLVDAAERERCREDFFDGEVETMVEREVCCCKVEVAREWEDTWVVCGGMTAWVESERRRVRRRVGLTHFAGLRVLS